MGNKTTKSSLRNAIVYLNISADSISANDDKFWGQIFGEELLLADEVIKNITVQEIRILRDGSPKNFATLAYKMVERLCLATGTLCNTQSQQTAVLNAIRILIRMLPCCFEDRNWRYFFENNHINLASELRKDPELIYREKKKDERDYCAYLPQKPGSRSVTPLETNASMDDSSVVNETQEDVDLLMSEQPTLSETKKPAKESSEANSNQQRTAQAGATLMKSLVLSICDLLFCPEFTVLPHGVGYLANKVDTPPEDLKSLSTYDYVWEPGVGFESNINSTTYYDKNRSELLCALLVCLSVTLYETPESSIKQRNRWIEILVSQENRHALPLFTSLLNVVLGYKPSRALLQFNHQSTEGSRERLVGLSAQLLSALLDYQISDIEVEPDTCVTLSDSKTSSKNLFIDYMSRIHRSEDFVFMMRGFISLMNDGLGQGYIWASTKYLELEQELQLLFWRTCNLNRKFMQYLLSSNEVQHLVVPILHHLNENFRKPSKTALIHIGVFNLLILSSERNFGVRLNKAYTANTLGNLPDFTGSHADLMIIVFHKLIMYGYKINQLYDYLLTILVNVSPYLKGTTILASKCLIQLFETFSSPLVVFTEPSYHQMVIFLLEFFNNIIQYQFDGNSNLIYILLTKKELLTSLANMPTSQASIDKVLKKLIKQKQRAKEADTASDNQSVLNQTGGASGQMTAHNEGAELSNSDEDTNQDSATVSCSNSSSVDTEKNQRKQEVSLVATPDLYHVTLPVFPFGAGDEKKSSTDSHGANGKTSSQEQTMFSFDDFVTDSKGNPIVASGSNESESRVESEQDTSTTLVDDFLIETQPGRALGSLISDKIGAVGGANNARATAGDKWRPTSEWLKSWKKTLPLQAIMRMISALDPQIEQMKHSSGRVTMDEAEIISFLQNGTLVGLLPVPHPIQIRKYRTTSSSTMWFRACLWGIIYVRSTIWTGTDIKLIKMR